MTPDEVSPHSNPSPVKPKVPRGLRVNVTIGDKSLAVYSGMKFKAAIEELTKDMTIYHGARLSQVAEEIYKQGKKDGARIVFEAIDDLKDVIPHRNPGQPKKRRRR